MDIALVKQFEADGKAFIDKAISGLKTLQGFESVQHIEDAFPAAKHLAERLLGAIPVIGQVEAIADAMVAAYAFAEAIGLKGMDANEMASHEDWHTE